MKRQEKREQIKEWLKDPNVSGFLNNLSHPNRRPRESALDWAHWMMAHSGVAGRENVYQYINKIVNGSHK